ncbi:MAG: T9SS type A sorting domain-containing protein [Chitinophagaceae bacterium]
MKKLTAVILTCSLLLFKVALLAQNCTINAGVNQVICNSQPLVLTATTAGNPNATPAYQWVLVSGAPVAFTAPGALSTSVTGINPGNYIFQFSGMCADGITAFDSVNVQVLPAPAQPLAGADIQICTPGSVSLSANAAPPGQTGTWIIPTTTTGITIATPGNPNSNATATTGGVKPLIWKIGNAACSLNDTVNVRVLNAATISAGANFTAGCTGSCITLNGSDPGLSPQVGLWQLVSGPSTPTFANSNLKNTSVCNLVPGVYVFKWNVSGPCSNGSAQVTVTVSNTYTAPIVGSAVTYTSFCNTSGINSLVLKAVALAPGETGTWSFISGPSTPSIVSPAKSNTLVTGLNGSGVYVFNFTVVNGHCTSTVAHTVYFQETLTGLTTPPDQQLNCGVASTTALITYTGLSNTNGLTRNGVLVSGPITAGVTTVRSGSGTTDTWTMAGMTASGKYLFRYEYRTACGTMFQDMFVYVSNSPTAATAGSDQLIPCSATSTALAGNNPAVGAGLWSQVDGPNLVAFSSTTAVLPTISGLIQGVYNFRWTVSGGGTCPPTQDEVTVVKASTTVVAANAGPDVTVCPGSFKLAGNTPGLTQTGTWTVSPSAGISFSNANDPRSFVSGVAPNTVHTFTWTIKNACTSSNDAVVVSTNANNPIPVPNAGADGCLANGITNINLVGNTAAGIISSWSALDGGSIGNSSSAVTTATVTGNGTYRYEYSLTAPGCSVLYDTVVFTIAPTTSVSAAGADQNICAATLPQSVNLTATAPVTGTGAWSQTAGDGGAIIVTPGSNATTVNNLVAGQFEFRYLISNGVCPISEDRVLVNVTPAPTTANAGPDIAQCSATASTVIAMAGNTPVSGTGTWSIVSGPFGTAPTFSNATSPVSNITGLSNGVYVLRWTISTGPACAESSDDITLTVSRAADANATVAGFCDVTSISLAGNPGTSGTWTNTSKPAAAVVPTITAITGENAFADNISKGAYIFNYSIPAIGACPTSNSSKTVNIYTAATSLADAGADISLCTGFTTATLTGNTPATGTAIWSLISGPNTPTPSGPNTNPTDTSLANLAEGLYLYRYSINTNTACAASADTVMIIKERTANALPNQRLCNVTSASLTGNAPVYSTGSWAQVSGPNTAAILLPSSAGTPINGLVPGTYVFSWSIAAAGACPASTSNVQVVIDAPVSATNAGADISICPASASPTLGSTPAGGATYLWSPASYLSDATAAAPDFNGTSYPGTFTYTLNTINGSCNASDQVVVTVRPYPADFSVSKAAYTTFTAVDAGAGSSYLWNFGLNSTPATANTIGPFNVTYSISGTKTASLTVTDGNLCTSTKSISFNAVSSALPLHLLTFAAQPQGENAILSWTVADAVNVKLFSIEKSTNGISYTTAGQVSFSPAKTTYNFEDVGASLSGKLSYYRLKMIDIDGTFSYSDTRILKWGGPATQPAVSPNPFINQFIVTASLEKRASVVSLVMTDSRGGVVLLRKISGLKEGINKIQVNVPDWIAKGIYFLRVDTEKGQPVYIKLIKE